MCSSTVKRGPASGALPGMRVREPITPVSVEPNPSIVITFGSSEAIWAFVDGESTAPPDAKTSSDDTS